ncbi:MAG: hypothetical protein NZL93_01755, partial [Chthoniobacterales bacterium]|nr:hypothetical protein [Chthoniobacterales bacterium]
QKIALTSLYVLPYKIHPPLSQTPQLQPPTQLLRKPTLKKRPRRLHIPKPSLHQLVMRVRNPLLSLFFHTPPPSSTSHPPRRPSLFSNSITSPNLPSVNRDEQCEVRPSPCLPAWKETDP